MYSSPESVPTSFFSPWMDGCMLCEAMVAAARCCCLPLTCLTRSKRRRWRRRRRRWWKNRYNFFLRFLIKYQAAAAAATAPRRCWGCRVYCAIKLANKYHSSPAPASVSVVLCDAARWWRQHRRRDMTGFLLFASASASLMLCYYITVSLLGFLLLYFVRFCCCNFPLLLLRVLR